MKELPTKAYYKFQLDKCGFYAQSIINLCKGNFGRSDYNSIDQDLNDILAVAVEILALSQERGVGDSASTPFAQNEGKKLQIPTKEHVHEFGDKPEPCVEEELEFYKNKLQEQTLAVKHLEFKLKKIGEIAE